MDGEAADVMRTHDSGGEGEGEEGERSRNRDAMQSGNIIQVATGLLCFLTSEHVL